MHLCFSQKILFLNLLTNVLNKILSRFRPLHIIFIFFAFFGTAYFLAGLSNSEADLNELPALAEVDEIQSRENYFQNLLMQENVTLLLLAGVILLLFLIFSLRKNAQKREGRTFLKNQDQLEQALKPEEEPRLTLTQKLARDYPELTAGELELAGLLLRHPHSKEVAQHLNISPASVNTARYRLRKKLGLQKGEDLLKFLLSYS